MSDWRHEVGSGGINAEAFTHLQRSMDIANSRIAEIRDFERSNQVPPEKAELYRKIADQVRQDACEVVDILIERGIPSYNEGVVTRNEAYTEPVPAVKQPANWLGKLATRRQNTPVLEPQPKFLSARFPRRAGNALWLIKPTSWQVWVPGYESKETSSSGYFDTKHGWVVLGLYGSLDIYRGDPEDKNKVFSWDHALSDLEIAQGAQQLGSNQPITEHYFVKEWRNQFSNI